LKITPDKNVHLPKKERDPAERLLRYKPPIADEVMHETHKDN
jgi:hypothetical protein